MEWALAMVLLLGQVDAKAAPPAAAPPPLVPSTFKIRRSLTDGSKVTTALDACELAEKDAESLGDAARCAFYVWVPDHIEPASGFGQTSLIANSTFSRTPNIVQPTAIAGGRIVRLDLDKFAAKDEQVEELLKLRELLAPLDTVFNDEGDDCEILLADGSWGKASFVRRERDTCHVTYGGKPFRFPSSNVRLHFGPADYLGSDGEELFALTHSQVPIMRLDEFVRATFSTVNGGQYYRLVGTKATLAETIREFCGDDAAEKVTRASDTMRQAEAESRQTGQPLAKIASRLDPELAKSKCYISQSGVTGRQRLVLAINGEAIPPAVGTQRIFVTFDIQEGNVDPESDPRRSPLNFDKYDGGEAIFHNINGTLVYLVTDAQDRVIDSVPDNVTADTAALKVRSNAASLRVFSGLSCANCHEQGEKNYGWQPVPRSEAMQRRLFTFLDDDSQRSRREAVQRFTAQYSGDLNPLLDDARIVYQHQAQLATRHTSTRETIFGMADQYWGSLYDLVTPRQALMELTGEVEPNDKAAGRLLEIVRDVPFDERHVERDVILADLADGLSVTPAQWRAIYQETAAHIDLEIEGVKP